MKTVIKHGSRYSKYKIKCHHCGCIFIYESNDVECYEYTLSKQKYITCPDCGETFSHYETNMITDEN